MKFTPLAIASLATFAAAAPVAEPVADPMADPPHVQRQACNVGFVFARGSTEMGGLGFIIGPSLQSSLRSKIPGMQTFPVGYAASIMTNISFDRTDAASIAEGAKAFQKAAGCKTIIAGGYSQGAAVMHNVIGLKKSLTEDLKSKIAGVALFGDTRNQQDKGHIPNFPAEKSKVWCNPSDGVCGGLLNVNVGHLSYSNGQINEAATWLASRVKARG